MNFYLSKLLVVVFLVLSFFSSARGSSGRAPKADTTFTVYQIDTLIELARKNNQSLKVSASGVDIAHQGVDVARSRRYPTVSTSLTAGYLGDVSLIDKDFSNATNVPMPHFANSFSMQASQLIFKGNAINSAIATASLQEQIAALNLEEDVLDVKLLVAGNYLDLYKLYNQKTVYEKNLELARLRFEQIQKLYKAGMVTRNDLIRSELQIANLKLARQVVVNNAGIVNKQLTTATGLPSTVVILPDSAILNAKPVTPPQYDYESVALKNYPALQSARINTEVAEKNLQIAKSDLSPSLSLYAGSSLDRPLTSSSPALDMYSHGWQAGLSLAFNIDALYKAPQNIKLNKLRVVQSRELETLQEQNRSVVLNAAYIRHNEAISRWTTLRQNMLLANENYRIVEKKYLNQLALFIDMLDASNEKLNAELEYTNAEINILYTYYQLQKEAGIL